MYICARWVLNHLHSGTDKDSIESELMKDLFIFKTTVTSTKEAMGLRPFLDRLLLQNGAWNFDLEDCDNILRVEAFNMHPARICELLQQHGYGCEELPD